MGLIIWVVLDSRPFGNGLGLGGNGFAVWASLDLVKGDVVWVYKTWARIGKLGLHMIGLEVYTKTKLKSKSKI